MTNHLAEFIKNPTRTGTIAPDSMRVRKTMVKMARISRAKAVVEIGPGSGGFTAEILKTLPSDAVFFAIDLNKSFIKDIKKKYSGLSIYNDDAVNIIKYMKKHKLKCCDAVISGLPFSAMDAKAQNNLIKAIKDSLAFKGRFVTYTYMHRRKTRGNLNFKKRLKKNFAKLEESPVIWGNLPPAYIYCATK